MNREKLEACGIDYEEGVRRFSGHVAIYEKYLKRLPGLDIYEELQRSIAKGDVQAAFESAHQLKAFIGNLSIPALFVEISQLTDKLRAGCLEGADEALARIDTIFTGITDVIRDELQ